MDMNNNNNNNNKDGEKAVVACFMVLSQNSSTETEKVHANLSAKSVNGQDLAQVSSDTSVARYSW